MHAHHHNECSDGLIQLNLSIPSSADLGVITLGGCSIPYNDKGYDGGGCIEGHSDWIPMFFSKPGKYIWFNVSAPDENAGVYGADCFSTTENPCSATISMIRVDNSVNITFSGSNVQWKSGMQSPPVPKYVPLQIAIEHTTNWREFWQGLGVEDSKNAMYIPITDIDQVINPPGIALQGNTVKGIRLYFALRNPKPDINDVGSCLHFYAVAVDDNDNDLLQASGNTLIYDTSMPCPPMCGSANVLNPDSICVQAFNRQAVQSVLNEISEFNIGASLCLPRDMPPAENIKISVYQSQKQNGKIVELWAHELTSLPTPSTNLEFHLATSNHRKPVLTYNGDIDTDDRTIIKNVSTGDLHSIKPGVFVKIKGENNENQQLHYTVMSVDAHKHTVTLDSKVPEQFDHISFYPCNLFLQAEYPYYFEGQRYDKNAKLITKVPCID